MIVDDKNAIKQTSTPENKQNISPKADEKPNPSDDEANMSTSEQTPQDAPTEGIP